MLDRMHILICGGTECKESNSLELRDKFNSEINKYQLDGDVKTILTGCFGLCALGPHVVIYPGETLYSGVKVEDIPEIVEQHIKNGKPVERLLYKGDFNRNKFRNRSELTFFARQKRIALRNCGVIDPLNINEYIARQGYEALGKVLTTMSPEDVINEMKKSGLRGRGGGGFSTGLKWDFARQSVSDQKYVICNADEGDPGAFMDRAVLEGDPHSVLEAMAICGYAIGADTGFIYIRAEYPVAVARLEEAIQQAKELGVLGNDLFGSGFDFNIEIRLGAGAFVCGEETALIASIEGGRGMPRKKPPFPAVRGLFGKPTNVNNVETFANIPVIFLKGADWFKSIGTEKSSGTKVFALGGKIANTGLLEIPMGTTLREVIYEIGGGIPNKREFKAVQTGGPSGGCITAASLDTPIDFDNLIELGSMMGSGGMIIMDEDNCMVDVARFYLEFTVDESCGKCTPCREGTKRMLDILNRICEGEGTLEDLDILESLGQMIKDSSLCGLGQTAPNPVLSTLKHFREEYIAHVVDKVCPAGVCSNLTNYVVTDDCIGCTKCAKNCPVGAIEGTVKGKHHIDPSICIKCGACKTACPVNAISTNPEDWKVA
ncbi:MAG: NADH-quinone oxidoreductase subunit NuoF [Bacilli bacterium]|nr:NADH-quinone oxidoreductase subunit NuoF [Bacilli bacterium]MBN2877165.1 NADH-quinone oxidoreductase subunit NuoF [Bacilli bacterium]